MSVSAPEGEISGSENKENRGFNDVFYDQLCKLDYSKAMYLYV